MSIQLVWFKRDLRLDDHRPLHRAAREGPVLGVYLVEPELLELPETHPRHLAFLRESLEELREGIRARGGELWVRRGEAVQMLGRVCRELADAGHPVGALYSHEETGLGVTYARDRRVAAWARSRGIPWREEAQFGVVRGLRDRDGWARRWESRMNESPLAPPDRLPRLPETVRRMAPGEIGWLRTAGDGAGSGPRTREGTGDRAGPRPGRRTGSGAEPDVGRWRELQQPGGEAAGRDILASFLAGRGVNYRAGMASPVTAWDDCSRLSPHLAYGTVSLRRVHHATGAAVLAATRRRKDGDPSLDPRRLPSLRSFEKRLRWHCHFIQKLESEPEIEFHAMNRAYEGLRTREEEWGPEERARFEAWRTGRTGYPMVDACMRALEDTGWINFRMRAMLVSFAAYHLWLDWRPVARELARRFLDFEPGIHISQCQMQSGVTGINQLRIYSPAKQVTDNDPQGVFIRRWVPELEGVPEACLPRPETMRRSLQDQVGCRIGRDYPEPLVEHREAVRRARTRIGEVRSSPRARRMARRVYDRHGSRRRSARSRGLTGDGPSSRGGEGGDATAPPGGRPPGGTQLGLGL